MLIVEQVTGRIVEVREGLVEAPSGDRFKDALEKVGEDPVRAREKFEQSRKELPGRQKAIEEKFKDSLKRVRPEDREKEGPREIDL